MTQAFNATEIRKREITVQLLEISHEQSMALATIEVWLEHIEKLLGEEQTLSAEFIALSVSK